MSPWGTYSKEAIDFAAGIGVSSSTRPKSDEGVLKSEELVVGGESSGARFILNKAKFFGIGVMTSWFGVVLKGDEDCRIGVAWFSLACTRGR